MPRTLPLTHMQTTGSSKLCEHAGGSFHVIFKYTNSPHETNKKPSPERCASEVRDLDPGRTAPRLPAALYCGGASLLTRSPKITEPSERAPATGDYDSACGACRVRFRRRVRDVQFNRRRVRAVRRYVLIKTTSFLKRIIFWG